MKTAIWAMLVLFLSTSVSASELIHQFNSPAFSGQGYSSHVLTIEQLENQRKKDREDDRQAELDRAERDRKSTNAYKFQNNLESRIYAQLSKQISDSLFGEGATPVDGEWSTSETPFGDQISWKREDGRIYVTVTDSTGTAIAEFDVPVGEFAF